MNDWAHRSPASTINPTDIAIGDIAREASHIHFGSLTPQGQSDIPFTDTDQVTVPTQALIANSCSAESYADFFPEGAKFHQYPCLSIAIRSTGDTAFDRGTKSELMLTQGTMSRLLDRLDIEHSITVVSRHENPEDIAMLGGKFVLQVIVPPAERQTLSELASQLQYEFAQQQKPSPTISFQ